MDISVLCGCGFRLAFNSKSGHSAHTRQYTYRRKKLKIRCRRNFEIMCLDDGGCSSGLSVLRDIYPSCVDAGADWLSTTTVSTTSLFASPVSSTHTAPAWPSMTAAWLATSWRRHSAGYVDLTIQYLYHQRTISLDVPYDSALLQFPYLNSVT